MRKYFFRTRGFRVKTMAATAKKNKKHLEVSQDLLLRERLNAEIGDRMKELEALTEDAEQLKTELLALRAEYRAAIGPLYRRLDELDTDILRVKKIKALMRKGIDFARARRAVDMDKSSAAPPRPEEEQAREKPEKDPDFPTGKKLRELKTLWRKLVCRFHPDLTTQPEEARRCETIIKIVNRAYADGDIDALKRIDLEHGLDDPGRQTAGTLKARLEQLKKTLTRIKGQILQLKKTAWFSWSQKIAAARKQKRDLIKELEQKLQLRIMKKERQLLNLSKGYDFANRAAEN